MKLATVAVSALFIGVGAGCSTLNETKQEPSKPRFARICDTSGCYIAWGVVDSDRDGVSDADELMAGTDPYDPRSRPRLSLVADLGGKALLPSFEAGAGVFFVFPADLQAMVKKSITDPLAAFPLAGERAASLVTAFPLHVKQEDTLMRLGISAAQLTQHGIDVKRDGLTVGFGGTTKTGAPERRIGGLKVSMISADGAANDEPVPLPRLPHEDVELADGTIFMVYKDGTMRWNRPDGSSVVLDKNGDPITILYVNPDAEQASVVTAPTPEQKAAFARVRGAAIRTVEGWSAPRSDNTPPRDRRSTIILVDAEYAYNPAMIFETPKVTTAQPDVRPDLPRPDVPATPGVKPCITGCP